MRVRRLILLLAVFASCTSAAPPRARHAEPVAAAARPTPPAPPPAATEAPSSTISRAELLVVLDAGIPRFLQQVETEPALEQSRFVGFRLTSFFPGDARYRGVDLRPGDVVVKVNGLPVERPEQAYRVWQELRVASELRVEYLRDGAAHELRYAIVDG